MIRTVILSLALASCAPLAPLPADTPSDLGLHDDLHALETRSGGRLGVVLLDDDGRSLVTFRGDQRFAFCSAFKVALGAAAFAAAADGALDLDTPITYARADFPGYQPVLERRIDASTGSGSISLRDAIAATVTVSDNMAANLLIDALGSPAAVTAIWRDWGDKMSRLDRRETALNENRAGDERDTSTPHAMADLLRRLLSEDLLSSDDREALALLTHEATTGLTRVRAGLPADWRAGDKTGTCKNDGSPDSQSNDIGWFTTPDGRTFWFAVMLARYGGTNADANVLQAEIGKLFADRLSR